MNLETISEIASVVGAVFGLLSLIGIGMIFNNKNKQNNNPNVVVNGDASFDGSFNVSNKANQEMK